MEIIISSNTNKPIYESIPSMRALAKYMINLIFALAGCLTGIVVTLVVNRIQGKKMEVSLWGVSILGICIGVFLGSVLIPLLIQFGTEKAGIIMVGIIVIPILIGLV